MRQFLAIAFTTLYLAAPASAQDEPAPLSPFTANILIHVVAHEMGHALIREFDLPILTYEEAMADDFATLLILEQLPERAEAIFRARAQSHIADGDTPSIFSEYLHDAQRAGRMICLAYGLDPERFIGLAEEFGMDIEDAGDACIDLAPEVARSWRRLVAPLRMPADAPVTEVRLRADVSDTLRARLGASDVVPILRDLLVGFDWHSLITLEFIDCDGSAGWRRNGREIFVCSAYIARFEALAAEFDR